MRIFLAPVDALRGRRKRSSITTSGVRAVLRPHDPRFSLPPGGVEDDEARPARGSRSASAGAGCRRRICCR